MLVVESVSTALSSSGLHALVGIVSKPEDIIEPESGGANVACSVGFWPISAGNGPGLVDPVDLLGENDGRYSDEGVEFENADPAPPRTGIVVLLTRSGIVE